MSDFILVRDDGFHPHDGAEPVVLTAGLDLATLGDYLDHDLIAISFPAMTDGRGFTLARMLRAKGYKGRLRAVGALISDQYAMARRVGFDEVEIPAALAARQTEEQWLFRADWQDWDHRSRLAG